MEMRYTRIQWKTAVATAAVNILTAFTVSLQAPFYPAEAEQKGATATEYGFVFGSYELTIFIVSPLIGKTIEKYGIRCALVGGMTLCSTAVIFFGLLDNIQSRILFVGLSILLRIVESLGAASAMVSAFSLIGVVFPDDVATAFATLEIFYGVGFIVGPTVGGLLYALGGYSLPFVCVGTLGIIIALSILVFIPIPTKKRPQRKENYKVISVLKVPAITLSAICVVMFTLSTGFYSALLEPHLRQFGLPAHVASLFFVINGLTYAIVSPLLGRLLDSSMEPSTVIIAGCVFVICNFTIMGPAPFLSFQATIPSCVVALVMQGCAQAAGNVATFTEMFTSARKAGFPDTVGTYSLISGIWTSASSFGGFVGPTVAGILYDFYGFRWATQFVFGSFIILLVVVLIFVMATKRRNKQDNLLFAQIEERTPILVKLNVPQYC